MTDESKVRALFEDMIAKMQQQSSSAEHQSIGSLAFHLSRAKDALRDKRYLDPLYIVEIPRWLGDYGNTPLEDEIYAISIAIGEEAIRLCGGIDLVNAARRRHNSQR